MNKTTWRKLQVLLVIKICLFTLNSFCQKNNESSDYKILLDILKKNKKSYLLIESNDNLSLINKIKILHNEINNTTDSIKQITGIKNDTVLISMISNKENYNHLINQLKENSLWDKKKVKNKTTAFISTNEKSIFVSKPVYFKKSNWAFIDVETPTLSYILVYKKDKENWREYKLIFPLLKQSRVKLIEE